MNPESRFSSKIPIDDTTTNIVSNVISNNSTDFQLAPPTSTLLTSSTSSSTFHLDTHMEEHDLRPFTKKSKSEEEATELSTSITTTTSSSSSSSLASSSTNNENEIYAEYAGQTYGVTTYDAAFKHVLYSDNVRLSFLRSFVPGLNVTSSTILDEYMRPVVPVQRLRNFLSSTETLKTLALFKNIKPQDPNLIVSYRDEKHTGATNFLQGIISNIADIKKSIPDLKKEGKMDVVCQLDNGDYALVEMQVVEEDNWDNRALAYLAFYYGDQIKKGEHWKQLKKVIGINILGGGKNDIRHRSEPTNPNQYVRHYKFQEQCNKESVPRFIEGMELWQYSIQNIPDNLEGTEGNQELKEWLLYFHSAHKMTEDEVKNNVTTPAVLEAFERIKLAKLPLAVLQNYKVEDDKFERYSTATNKKVSYAVKDAEEKRQEAEEKLHVAEEREKTMIMNMIKNGFMKEQIMNLTGWSMSNIENLIER